MPVPILAAAGRLIAGGARGGIRLGGRRGFVSNFLRGRRGIGRLGGNGSFGFEIRLTPKSAAILNRFGSNTSNRVTKDNLSKLLLGAAFLVESKAKTGHYPPGAPVDTGRLRSSITSQVSGDKAQIFTRSGYGLYVHEGTFKQRPQPFFIKSAKAARPDIKKLMDRVGKDISIKLVRGR